MDIREFVKKYVGYGAVQKFEDFLFYLRFGKIVLNTKGTNRVIIKMGGNEVDIMCDDDEVIRNLSSSHEIKNVGIYMKYLNEYNVYIDIGANIGVYLVLASFIMDKKKKLLGFEPGLEAFLRLQKNVGKTNAKIYNIGLSNVNKEFFVKEEYAGVALSIDDTLTTGRKIQCKIGDHLLEDYKGKSKFIKIDVEGHEGEVIAGFANLLKSSEKIALYVEIHSKILEENNKKGQFKLQIWELKKNGFKIKWIDRSHILITN